MLNERKKIVHKFQKYHMYIISNDAINYSNDTGAKEKNKYIGYG